MFMACESHEQCGGARRGRRRAAQMLTRRGLELAPRAASARGPSQATCFLLRSMGYGCLTPSVRRLGGRDVSLGVGLRRALAGSQGPVASERRSPSGPQLVYGEAAALLRSASRPSARLARAGHHTLSMSRGRRTGVSGGTDHYGAHTLITHILATHSEHSARSRGAYSGHPLRAQGTRTGHPLRARTRGAHSGTYPGHAWSKLAGARRDISSEFLCNKAR